jgi:probable H4MPT-linked C1 transfer pathway protein
LCDCFENRAAGVAAILSAVREAIHDAGVRVFTNQGRFVSLDQARADPLSAASANWLALARFVARHFPSETVLLIDIGSTTCDITFLNQGKPEPRGLTDAGRLASSELVYTGLRRTPICAVLGMEVAAEFFASMLDAYLVKGLVAENADDCDTADGRPATTACAHARLARMRCTDAHLFSAEEASLLAERAITVQQEAVARAIERVLAGRRPIERIVLAGSGEIVARCVCARHPTWSRAQIESLSAMLGPGLSEAACAYAVAMLAEE